MPWLTSEQALARLGTKPQSLYASVSRGRIRARPDPDNPRRRLYDAGDIDRLASHAGGRRTTETVAGGTLRFGDPVLPSTLTTMVGGRLYYRGRDVVMLADQATLEEIAALLWGTAIAPLAAPPEAFDDAVPPWQRGLVAMARRAATDASSPDRPPTALMAEAATLVGVLANAFGLPATDAPLHWRLASAWRRPEAAQLLRCALVLLADHELNASAFAARIAASTGAPLAAAMLAGLATLTGPRHGGAAAALAALVRETHQSGLATLARDWLGPGHALPGFGHRLYPDGDPRATALLGLFTLPPAYAAFSATARELTGEAPNIDFALAALAAAFDLPATAPLLLFALARSVGWLAHALEQIATGTVIRPRASYVGIPPVPAAPDS